MGVRFKLPTSINLPLSLLIQGGFSTNCTSTTGVSKKKKNVWRKNDDNFNLSITDKSTIIHGFNKFCNQSLTVTPGYGKIICPVILGLIS